MSKFIYAFILLGLAFTLMPISTQAASKHHIHIRKAYPSSYFVSPPPAYMPSILPEFQAAEAFSGKNATSADPYRKYIYSAQGYETPIPYKSHRTVTYWNGPPSNK